MSRRRPGDGGLFWSPSAGLWIGVRDVDPWPNGHRRTKRVYSTTFCGALIKFSQLPPPQRRSPALTRQENLRRARELGTHTPSEWWAKVHAQNNLCYYCGANDYRSTTVRGRRVLEPHILTKDHMTPIGRGGSDAIDNIVGACLTCNMRKGQMTAEEFMGVLRATR